MYGISFIASSLYNSLCGCRVYKISKFVAVYFTHVYHVYTPWGPNAFMLVVAPYVHNEHILRGNLHVLFESYSICHTSSIITCMSGIQL